MAAFKETCALTSRIYAIELGIIIPNFRVFLPLRDPLVATSNEKRPPTSKKYVAGQAIVMPYLSKTFETLRGFYIRKTMVKSKFLGFSYN